VKLIHHLRARKATVGGGSVQRVLPQARCRQVGPWVFVDHFGPSSGPGMDVPPHPHIGLSTVTWLFDGCVEHRDSTGGHALVGPGEVHWMRAGAGITHSERVPADRGRRARRTHGLQLWCAHPDGEEDQAPRFDSWRDVPELKVAGVPVTLVAGTGWGEASPVDVTSPLVYAIGALRRGDTLPLPDHAERAVYVVSGEVQVAGVAIGTHEMAVVGSGAGQVRSDGPAVVAILGGAPIGERFIWWNLVHSDPAVLRQQAERWQRGGFPEVVGDPGPRVEGPDWLPTGRRPSSS